MRSIGVLDCVRKKKRRAGGMLPGCATLAFLTLSAALLFIPVAHAANGGSVVMQTPSGGATIGKDAETGTRVMQTPEPKEQESYQGPQTIIVSPEVYPGGGGNRQPGKPGSPGKQPR
ncbi:MAG: hypothetical protein DELT_00662 [Desulfovibrio sp.]